MDYVGNGGTYGGCSWNCNTMAMTSPGPDGAIFNVRLESFREGVQLAEAAFWTPAQAGFLREAILEDADWAEVIDELNNDLRARH